MKQRFTLTIAVLSLAGSILWVCGPSAAGEASRRRPSTRPAAAATQPHDADPDVEAGRSLARKDLSAGILGQKLAIPEAFMLQWMPRQDEDSNLLDYYKAVVADRFGVRCEEVMILPNYGDRALKRAAGYNEVMSDPIAQRCGSPDALHKAWVAACATRGSKRAAYLKARAAGSPTTRPAGTKKSPNANMNK